MPDHDHNYLSTKGQGESAESPVERLKHVFAQPKPFEPLEPDLQPVDPRGTDPLFEEAREQTRDELLALAGDLRQSVPGPMLGRPGTDITHYRDKAMFTAEPLTEGRERPRVYLLQGSADPLGAVAAFSMMYEGRVIRDLGEITDEERRQYFDECFKTALRSPLETIDLHFMVEGLTRASWDQMRTQRTAVFAGESLRFAVKEDLNEAVRPGPSVQSAGQRAVWYEAIEQVNAAYQTLVASGVVQEDARGLLPMNTLTRGHWKTNLRNLEAEIGKRLCTQAQFEWRLIHADLRKAIREYDQHAYRFTRMDGTKVWGGSGWQWEYIADSPLFKPICFQKGACMFKAKMDRGCTIRERVDAGRFDLIKTEEWLADPTAAWVQ